jgi:hypothetical protein
MLPALICAVGASLCLPTSANGLDHGGTVVTTVVAGTVGFVSATTDAAAQRCLADAGFELQLIDVTEAGYLANIAGALGANLAVALWHSIDPSVWADLSQTQLLGQELVLAAQSGGYAVGGTVFLGVHDVPVGTPAQQLLNWINSWSATVTAAGYVPGLRIGPNPGLTAAQLAAADPQLFWMSGGAVPALSIGYSVVPADPSEVAACGTTAGSYEVSSNSVGRTLTAVRHSTLGALPPESAATVSSEASASLSLGTPTISEAANGTSRSAQAGATVSATQSSGSGNPSTLSTTGGHTVALLGAAGALVAVGVMLLTWTRRRPAIRR